MKGVVNEKYQVAGNSLNITEEIYCFIFAWLVYAGMEQRQLDMQFEKQ